jgi:hypothetical protein
MPTVTIDWAAGGVIVGTGTGSGFGKGSGTGTVGGVEDLFLRRIKASTRRGGMATARNFQDF